MALANTLKVSHHIGLNIAYWVEVLTQAFLGTKNFPVSVKYQHYLKETYCPNATLKPFSRIKSNLLTPNYFNIAPGVICQYTGRNANPAINSEISSKAHAHSGPFQNEKLPSLRQMRPCQKLQNDSA